MKFIFLCTIQSTGIWWTINALRQHTYIGGLAHVQNLMALQNGWVLRNNWTGNPHKEALAPVGKATLVYDHYRAPLEQFGRWYPQGTAEHLMTVLPTISPLRDPLICLIRAWHREPPLYPHDYLVDEWIHAAQRNDTLGVRYWCMEPFDQPRFLQILTDIGLPEDARWANRLQPRVRVNSTPGECMPRVYYENGNTAALERALPKPWRRLREAEPILRPFLEQYGFRDLLWWS